MQQYESVIVLTPLLSDDAAKEVIAKFKNILTEGGAEIVAEDNWGLKKLAYPIQKKTTGHSARRRACHKNLGRTRCG